MKSIVEALKSFSASKSYLAKEIKKWAAEHPEGVMIAVGSGLIGDLTSRRSKVGTVCCDFRASENFEKYPHVEVLIGGHLRNGTEGWHWAVVAA